MFGRLLALFKTAMLGKDSPFEIRLKRNKRFIQRTETPEFQKELASIIAKFELDTILFRVRSEEVRYKPEDIEWYIRKIGNWISGTAVVAFEVDRAQFRRFVDQHKPSAIIVEWGCLYDEGMTGRMFVNLAPKIMLMCDDYPHMHFSTGVLDKLPYQRRRRMYIADNYYGKKECDLYVLKNTPHMKCTPFSGHG